jgi:hypothetical protein
VIIEKKHSELLVVIIGAIVYGLARNYFAETSTIILVTAGYLLVAKVMIEVFYSKLR